MNRGSQLGTVPTVIAKARPSVAGEKHCLQRVKDCNTNDASQESELLKALGEKLREVKHIPKGI